MGPPTTFRASNIRRYFALNSPENGLRVGYRIVGGNLKERRIGSRAADIGELISGRTETGIRIRTLDRHAQFVRVPAFIDYLKRVIVPYLTRGNGDRGPVTLCQNAVQVLRAEVFLNRSRGGTAVLESGWLEPGLHPRPHPQYALSSSARALTPKRREGGCARIRRSGDRRAAEPHERSAF